MEHSKIKLKDLKPADYNPRTITESQAEKLKNNLDKFGLVDPIIINLKNNHIIGGHQRYNILIQETPDKELNLIRLGDIGWVFEDTVLTIEDDNHEKALNLSLNRLDGEFDTNKLNQLFEELQADDFDMDLTGFEDYEIIEYGLDDFELDLDDEFDADEDDILNFTDENTTDEYETLNIHLGSNRQRQQLLELISGLKKENPDRSIAENLINYLENNIQPEENVQPYTILFDNQEQKNKFQQLQDKLTKNKRYTSNPIIQLKNEGEP
jgi:ParB-like chromosome segregation protein Spo0J